MVAPLFIHKAIEDLAEIYEPEIETFLILRENQGLYNK